MADEPDPIDEMLKRLPMTINEHWEMYNKEYLTEGAPVELKVAIKQAFFMGVFSMFGMTSHLSYTAQRDQTIDANAKWDAFRKEIDDFLENTPAIKLRTRKDLLREFLKSQVN